MEPLILHQLRRIYDHHPMSTEKRTTASAFLISALLVLTVGCETNSRTACPVQSSFSSLQLTDANGVQTYGIVRPSYQPDVQSRWVLYNLGSGLGLQNPELLGQFAMR
jgi:hypothetical protein